MLLSEAIDRYLGDRRAKGFAKGTVRSNQMTLRQFLADVGNIHVAQIQPRHMDTYVAAHPDWSRGYFNKNRANLAMFFKWCQVRGHLPRSVDPLEGVRRQKVRPRDRLIIPPSDWDRVLDAAASPRDRIIVALGLYLFTRVSETRMLRWGDVNFDTKEITVTRVKTHTIDTLPMCEELESELRRWRLIYADLMGELPQPGWYVAPSFIAPRFIPGKQEGKYVSQEKSVPIPTRYLRDPTKRIQIALERCGYTELDGEGGHTLRRSGATALYNELSSRGHDKAIRLTQAMLGHAQIQTTEIYLALDLDRKSRNDLLAGKKMFPSATGGSVVQLREVADGAEDAHGV